MNISYFLKLFDRNSVLDFKYSILTILLNHSYINQVDIKDTHKNVWPSITLKDRNHMSYRNGVSVCAEK